MTALVGSSLRVRIVTHHMVAKTLIWKVTTSVPNTWQLTKQSEPSSLRAMQVLHTSPATIKRGFSSVSMTRANFVAREENTTFGCFIVDKIGHAAFGRLPIAPQINSFLTRTTNVEI